MIAEPGSVAIVGVFILDERALNTACQQHQNGQYGEKLSRQGSQFHASLFLVHSVRIRWNFIVKLFLGVKIFLTVHLRDAEDLSRSPDSPTDVTR